MIASTCVLCVCVCVCVCACVCVYYVVHVCAHVCDDDMPFEKLKQKQSSSSKQVAKSCVAKMPQIKT